MALCDGVREGVDVGDVSLGLQRERTNRGLGKSEGARSTVTDSEEQTTATALDLVGGTPRRLRTMLLAIISNKTTRRETTSAGYLQLRASSGAGSAIEDA
jgi:hypothetical protein